MKPLCTLCHSRHESYQAHVFSPLVRQEPGDRLDWAVANGEPVANSVANAVANKKRKLGKYKDPEARKKYMRELMRKRRAKGA